MLCSPARLCLAQWTREEPGLQRVRTLCMRCSHQLACRGYWWATGAMVGWAGRP